MDLKTSYNLAFWFHLLITVLSWLGPFLFSWQYLVPIYLLVIIQFMIFDRCLLNSKHELSTADDYTFYAFLLERIGMRSNASQVKFFVHKVLYYVLTIICLAWQLGLGNAPLLF